MRVLLLGASGRTGRYVVEKIIQAGYELNCLVRDHGKIKSLSDKMTIFEGAAEKISDLEKAISNCDAIINVLNVSRNSDFPWAKLRTPPTFLSDVSRNVVMLAEKNNVRRIVVCSAWGVAETKNDLPGWFRWLIDNSNIGYAYRDHERQEKIVRESKLAWTIVRPAGLTNFKGDQQIIESYNNIPKPRMTINRVNLARYLVDALTDARLVHKMPVVSGR
ncbi:MAG TPA: NAD(P)H-binding protein [Chryseolinea sp.]